MLWETSWLALFGAAIAILLLAIEFGFRLGQRLRRSGPDPRHDHVSALQAALLGLLALLLGFTFAMAVSRFDARKELVLEEANAIGTAQLRAQVLADPAQRADAAQLFRDYVAARLEFYDAGIDAARLAAANAAAARLQGRLWELASAAAQQDPRSVPAGLFLQALNDVIDVSEKRLTALENHVPESVLYLLFVVTVVAVGFVSFGSGLDGERHHVSTTVFAVLVALVLGTIVDLDRPRRGLIKVSQQPIERLQSALRAAEEH